jgi:serine protease
VNSGAQGKLDGFSIVLGHEMEETITDPGAEDVVGSGISPSHLGGWYDTLDANENGDKCAWVGLNVATGQGTVPIPGALGDIKGNGGEIFAVQSLWSNAANAGTGYCAGANDSPLPSGS